MEGVSFRLYGRQASRVQITHCMVLMDQGSNHLWLCSSKTNPWRGLAWLLNEYTIHILSRVRNPV
ncbi:hypothetical protein NC653_040721 [Populus alba x Populus x berolinensis]|uniref:Uncharacterized protein n=1 Tax=Populus alba x Populus x berolinensis TaxID=444605 RepID=A0AAD6L728_9ROSI|nr:hypothetical protein NC653_040721 [Populus alba x Populus x berolinensis]